MKVKQFIERISHDWLAKVVCFVIALIFYLFYHWSTVEKKVFVVPLHTKAENGIVAAGTYPSDVRVLVRAMPEELSGLRETDFFAYLDLNYLAKAGTYSVPVHITLSENVMAAAVDPLEIKVMPETVTLTVEEQISAFVPIQPLVSGKPAYGYELKSVTVQPPEAMLTGPRSMVENCQRLQTKPVSADGLTGSATKEALLESPGIFLTSDSEETVAVTFEIAPIIVERTYDRLRVNLTNVAERLEASASDTFSVTIRGTQNAIEKYSPSGYVLYANCSQVSEAGTVEVPLSISIPSQFTVVGDVPKTVTVIFKEKPAPLEAEISQAEEAAAE